MVICPRYNALSPLSLFLSIEQAQQIEDFNVTFKEEAPKPAAASEEATSTDGAEKKTDDMDTTPASPKEERTSTTTAESSSTTSSSTKTKKVTRKYDLTITPNLRAPTSTQIQTFQQLELEMQASDRLVIDTAEKRNALEEYVYDVRGKLEVKGVVCMCNHRHSFSYTFSLSSSRWLGASISVKMPRQLS